MKNSFLLHLLLTLVFAAAVFAQTETLTNADIAEMSAAGLSSELIITKIEGSNARFDTTTRGLVEMKKADVSNEVIAAMMKKNSSRIEEPPAQPAFSESQPDSKTVVPAITTPKQAVLSAKTIALEKSSLQPSRQALEKELMKRADWKKLNLTILRYKEQADLYVEIGYVSGSWLTHRYVYRIYDRRNGAVVAAGETTSWGSLAENLARHIAKDLARLSA